MEGYYSAYHREKQSRRSLLARLFDWLLLLVSIVSVVAMILTLFVPYIPPSDVWLFPVLGLLAPGVYVINVVLMLYWIIRWRWRRAGVMLFLVVVGTFSVDLFWRPAMHRITLLERLLEQTDQQLAELSEMLKQPDRTVAEETIKRKISALKRRHRLLTNNISSVDGIKLMTYNVRHLYSDKGGSSADSIAGLINSIDPDILCLQEYNPVVAATSERFMHLFDRYKVAGFGLPAETPKTQLILSKYRILRSGVALAPRSSVWADLLIGGDTVRLFNNHLQSTAITASDDRFITDKLFLSDTAREEKVRSIVRRFGANSVLRAKQADTIALAMAAVKGRRIVCGDFNDTPMSYVYRTMARGLEDAFSLCGKGYSSTFRGFYDLLRIDYVLNSEGLEVLSYDVIDVDYSDHRPVLVRLMITDFED